MVLLALPADCVLDEYDTDCSWAEQAQRQSDGKYGDITFGTMEEGDCLAMQDRNSFAEDFNRCIWVLFEDDSNVLIFDEHGSVIDEPDQFVCKGRQPLRSGNHSFMDEWKEGYYRVPPPVEAPSEIGRTDSVATPSNNLFMKEGTRIQESFKDLQDPSKFLKYGAVVGPHEKGVIMLGFDDGDLRPHSEDEFRWLVTNDKLCACTLQGGLIASDPGPIPTTHTIQLAFRIFIVNTANRKYSAFNTFTV